VSNELKSLLTRVEATDPATAKELGRHIDRLQDRRHFGLNFERHIPESVDLVGRPISVGDKVRFIPPRGATDVESDDTWIVMKITGKRKRVAALKNPTTKEQMSRAVKDLVFVAEFRDPIYPGLVPSGQPIRRGGDKPCHVLINAENFHALEAMLFTYQSQVDCIYIDPPYNTRDNDWKYNNDYVDPEDSYAHSQWLAFMERRLKLAKRLLNPLDSVLIVTIDEKEYLRLGLLLEQTFPDRKMQMVSSVINPRGIVRANEFSRSNEFIFFLWTPGSRIAPAAIEESQGQAVAWETMRRRAIQGARGRKGKGACGPNQFFAIHVDKKTGHIVGRGDPLPIGAKVKDYKAPKGCVAVFPARDDGTEMNWSLTDKAFDKRWPLGYVRAGKATPDKPQKHIIQYILGGVIEDIEMGRAVVTGHEDSGAVIAEYVNHKTVMAHTQWDVGSHNAQQNGTGLLGDLLPDRKFPYAKSLYAVEDTIRYFVQDKRDALVVDFFSGSGTTAHAVMRLNRQDGGRRRSVSVTNNEVAASEAAALRAAGHRPGDPEWEALGIYNHITTPRIRAAVTGQTPSGDAINERYKFIDEFPMSDGFEENVEFFTLTYENPAMVELDLAFERVAPLLWMRAGSEGRRIDERSATFDVADTYAVLFNVDASREFLAASDKAEQLRAAFIVTDDESQFQAVAMQLRDGVEAIRLYETYLRTFQINTGRI
jgi:adenine-specific DNA-methyltransferase